jgi:hypothetical protein
VKEICRRQTPSFPLPRSSWISVRWQRAHWWTNHFPQPTSFHHGSPCSYITWGWTIDPFLAAVQRSSLTLSTWTINQAAGNISRLRVEVGDRPPFSVWLFDSVLGTVSAMKVLFAHFEYLTYSKQTYFLAYSPKIKVGLSNHQSVCVSPTNDFWTAW